MAILMPFQALRPAPAVAARVAAVPYDVVSTDEARALASDPLSFLHVSRPEIDLPANVPFNAAEVYERARANFTALKAAAPLFVEEVSSLYVYALTRGHHTQTGVAGCFSVEEYDRGAIKRHELTRVEKEDDRTRHLVALRAQTGPVFLTYKASPEVDAVVGRVTAGAPLYDFVAADGVRHAVWRTDAADGAALVGAFGRVASLYIADGHHRAASASRARRELGASVHGASRDGFLAVAFPDREMQVLAYNRLVKDLAGRTPAAFLAEVAARCRVGSGGPTPARAGHVAMFLGEAWYDLELPPASSSRAADALDVSRLQDALLGPLLGIGDPRTDVRIEFLGGARGPGALEDRVRSQAAAVAFSMFPVAVADLMTISDAGDIMPPKSTWFEPKLRDGLLTHEL